MRADERVECSNCHLPVEIIALWALLSTEPHCYMCMAAVRGRAVDAAQLANAALLRLL